MTWAMTVFGCTLLTMILVKRSASGYRRDWRGSYPFAPVGIGNNYFGEGIAQLWSI
jgi:hypothetical protein